MSQVHSVTHVPVLRNVSRNLSQNPISEQDAAEKVSNGVAFFRDDLRGRYYVTREGIKERYRQILRSS